MRWGSSSYVGPPLRNKGSEVRTRNVLPSSLLQSAKIRNIGKKKCKEKNQRHGQKSLSVSLKDCAPHWHRIKRPFLLNFFVHPLSHQPRLFSSSIDSFRCPHATLVLSLYLFAHLPSVLLNAFCTRPR